MKGLIILINSKIPELELSGKLGYNNTIAYSLIRRYLRKPLWKIQSLSEI
jgi:hypothetical protein